MPNAYRPSWDAYFMAMAHLAAERSTCNRLLAGAVLVRDKRLIATGYNGAPPGMEHCDDVGHLMDEGHCIRTLHAEENTLLQSALFGISTEHTTIYTTFSPCYHCLKKLIAAGVTRIVASAMYRDERVRDVCLKTGIRFELFSPDPLWLDHLAHVYGSLPKEPQTHIKASPEGSLIGNARSVNPVAE